MSIKKGFIPKTQSSGSELDLYLQSGCGIQLGIGGTTGTVLDIAAAVFKACPVIVEVSIVMKHSVISFCVMLLKRNKTNTLPIPALTVY